VAGRNSGYAATGPAKNPLSINSHQRAAAGTIHGRVILSVDTLWRSRSRWWYQDFQYRLQPSPASSVFDGRRAADREPAVGVSSPAIALFSGRGVGARMGVAHGRPRAPPRPPAPVAASQGFVQHYTGSSRWRSPATNMSRTIRSRLNSGAGARRRSRHGVVNARLGNAIAFGNWVSFSAPVLATTRAGGASIL